MIGKMRNAALAGAVALTAGLLAAGSQAQAAVYTATYTGQVTEVDTSGNYTGFFDGSDVAAGKAFTAVFRWDEADAGAGSIDTPPLYSLYSGAMTATITVGASSFQMEAPDGVAGAVHDVAGDAATILHYIDRVYAPGQRYAVQLYTMGGAGLLNSWDWRTPGVYDLTAGNPFGAFVYQDLGFPGGIAGAQLAPTRLVVAVEGGVSAAPEPGAWALMILGFGGAGAVLRQRAGARRPGAATA